MNTELMTKGQMPLTMSSREIAELCDKDHRHVMRDIKMMLGQLSLDDRGYAQNWTHPQNGQQYPEYHLPKDLTLTLVAGYNVVLRKRIIDRWIELEGSLREIPDFSDPVVLIHLLTEHASKRIEAEQRAMNAEAKAHAMQEDVQAFERLAKAGGQS